MRYLELAELINRADGVHYVTTLTLGLHGGALGNRRHRADRRRAAAAARHDRRAPDAVDA